MPDFVAGCEPFYFERGQVGVLLIHGFTGTPREMRWMGEYLGGRGVTVLGMCLAGHATSPEDMERTTWHDWWGSVKEKYAELKHQCEKVFVMGLSLGGMLALHLGAHYPDVTGLVAMSTPGKPFEVADLLLSKPLDDAGRFILPSGESDIQDRQVVEEWHISYERTPVRCVASLSRFSHHLNDDLPDVRAPLLLIHSRLDTVAPSEDVGCIHSRVASLEKDVVWLERGGHVITEDYDKDTAFAQAYAFVQAHC